MDCAIIHSQFCRWAVRGSLFASLQVNGYVCLCPADYTGQHCDVKSSTCSSGKCASGSTCVNTPDGNDCECPDGYEGTFCEQQSNVRTRKKLSLAQCLLLGLVNLFGILFHILLKLSTYLIFVKKIKSLLLNALDKEDIYLNVTYLIEYFK